MSDRRRALEGLLSPGGGAAVLAAILFGSGAPLAKYLLGSISVWLLAGLLYLGSGISLIGVHLLRRTPRPRLRPVEFLYFAAAIAAGGIGAPLLMMMGLTSMPATDASLLLNAEGVVPALVAWIVFRENFDRRVASGMVAISLGALVLCWSPQLRLHQIYPSLLIL